jgi:uncharacterized cupin superfamily protein
MKPIVNIADLQYLDLAQLSRQMGTEMPEGFGGRMGPIGRVVGARRLGYNVTAVPPGKRGFPFHNHRLNEEMFFIIEGEGEVRIGSETFPVRQGDVIAAPPGGPETAHQIVNTGSGELKYLAVSTMDRPEVCQYPDSGKVAVLDGVGPGAFRYVNREAQQVDYWEGEEKR